MLVFGEAGRVAAGPGEQVVRGPQVLDLAGDLHPRGDEHDQVVADPFQVGDQVRGQHHAEPLVDHRLHQALQELAPGQRVEAGHRLVEEQQLGLLGEGEGQRQLGALAAGQLARPLALGPGPDGSIRSLAIAASQPGFRWAPKRR